jgi:hypothetical protein
MEWYLIVYRNIFKVKVKVKVKLNLSLCFYAIKTYWGGGVTPRIL